MLPKKPAKVLRVTLDRLFDQLCQEPSNPGTPVEVGMDMAPLDHDFKRRRSEVISLITLIRQTGVGGRTELLSRKHEDNIKNSIQNPGFCKPKERMLQVECIIYG